MPAPPHVRDVCGRRFRWIALTVLIGAAAACGNKKELQRADAPYHTTANGVVGGYDVVAYFTDGEAQPGVPEFATEWDGQQWRFATEEHQRMFEAEPEKYAPAYGGYCAFGMARGYPAPTSPQAWTIVDGRLYLNYDLKVQRDWRADRQALIAEADANWPHIRPAE